MAHQSKPVAVVTGASQGLGLALAKALSDEGWWLIVDARDGRRLQAAVARLPEDRIVVTVPGDVADAAHREAIARAATALGPVSLVINNASTLGASPLPRLDRIDPATFARIFAVNVIAPVALVQALVDDLAPGATIINVTSDAGVEAYEGWGGYGASKAALEHASHVLAAERPDLRVLIVDPGDMRTQMHQDAFPGEDISDRPEPSAAVPGFLELIHGTQPSGRYQARSLANASMSV
ncbi:MAG: SDR family oxidoreductase [Actinobacteria bacterium]|nr:MAG: SDR family oxidoreductase [Actinomycetota bacterium]